MARNGDQVVQPEQQTLGVVALTEDQRLPQFPTQACALDLRDVRWLVASGDKLAIPPVIMREQLGGSGGPMLSDRRLCSGRDA
jgi:hypothetical protein